MKVGGPFLDLRFLSKRNPILTESNSIPHAANVFILSSALPSVGIAERTHFAAGWLRPFGVSADTTIGTLELTKVELSQIGKFFQDHFLAVLALNQSSLSLLNIRQELPEPSGKSF